MCKRVSLSLSLILIRHVCACVRVFVCIWNHPCKCSVLFCFLLLLLWTCLHLWFASLSRFFFVHSFYSFSDCVSSILLLFFLLLLFFFLCVSSSVFVIVCCCVFILRYSLHSIVVVYCLCCAKRVAIQHIIHTHRDYNKNKIKQNNSHTVRQKGIDIEFESYAHTHIHTRSGANKISLFSDQF